MESLYEQYNKDLKEKHRSEEELKNKLEWVLNRAKLYAEYMGTTQEEIIKEWESHRNEWWLNYYQECNQPDPYKSKTPVMRRNEWLAKGDRLYGQNILNWKMICPMCKHVHTVGQFKQAGIDPNLAFTCCASRFGLGGKHDCKWTTGGLLKVGGVYIVTDKYIPVLAFDFADKEKEDATTFHKGDIVIIYTNTADNQHLAEIIDCLPENKYKLRLGNINLSEKTIKTKKMILPGSFLAIDKAATDKLKKKISWIDIETGVRTDDWFDLEG